MWLMPWIFSERLTCVRPLAALRPENAPNKLPLEVPKALLGDHYRHRFDLGRCFEAWVPSTCSINVPHGLRDPCWKWSELHRGERLGSSSRSIRAIGTPWGSGGGLEEAFSDFLGHHADLLEEHCEECVSGTLFLQVGWARMQPVGALI